MQGFNLIEVVQKSIDSIEHFQTILFCRTIFFRLELYKCILHLLYVYIFIKLAFKRNLLGMSFIFFICSPKPTRFSLFDFAIRRYM